MTAKSVYLKYKIMKIIRKIVSIRYDKWNFSGQKCHFDDCKKCVLKDVMTAKSVY